MRDIPDYLRHYLVRPHPRPWWTWEEGANFPSPYDMGVRIDGLRVAAFHGEHNKRLSLRGVPDTYAKTEQHRALWDFLATLTHENPMETNRAIDRAFPLARPPWCVGQVWAFWTVDVWTVTSVAKVGYRRDGTLWGVGLSGIIQGETFFHARPTDPLMNQLPALESLPALLLHNPFGSPWSSPEETT